MTKTLPNIANPHIRIYREIGQQVLAAIEDGWTHTHTQTDVIELYIRLCVTPNILLVPVHRRTANSDSALAS